MSALQGYNPQQSVCKFVVPVLLDVHGYIAMMFWELGIEEFKPVHAWISKAVDLEWHACTALQKPLLDCLVFKLPRI